MTRRTRSFGLLIALLTMFAVAKTQLDIGLGPSARDADYYFTIARAIALGEELRSTLSLYYQGFKEFPHFVRGLRPHSLRLVKEFGKGGAAIRLLALRDPDDAAP